MTSVRIEKFGGIAPLLDPRKLPPQGSVVASECKFVGTDLTPLLDHQLIASPGIMVLSRMFKCKDSTGVSNWVYWDFAAWDVVDVVPSPIPADALRRIYWTTKKDGIARATKQPAAGDITLSTGTTRTLGVPQPKFAPTVTENRTSALVGYGQPITITAMSKTSPVTVTTSGTHPFKDGWTVLVESTIASDGGMKELTGLQFIIANCTSSTFDLLNTKGATYTTFDAGSQVNISRVYTDAELETRSYCYTYVSDWGEEGPPSPPSPPAAYHYDSTENVNYTLDSTGANIGTIRVYRSAAGTSGANFFFTKEVAIGIGGATSTSTTATFTIKAVNVSQDVPVSSVAGFVPGTSSVTITDATYSITGLVMAIVGSVMTIKTTTPPAPTGVGQLMGVGAIVSLSGAGVGSSVILDDVKSQSLGELLPSTDWRKPPAGLQGLVTMPNGFLVGFIGNTLYQSEPYMPHAWPTKYTKTTNNEIVGIAVYGQTLVIATKGKPYLGTASDPSSMTLAELDLDAPCLSKGSVCSVGNGVMYATSNGLGFISAMAQQVITLPYFTRQQWLNQWWSNGMTAAFKDGRYIAFSSALGVKTLIIDNRPDSGMQISYTAVLGHTAAIDPDDDSLHFAYFTVGNADQNYQWEGKTTSLNAVADWKSKVFTVERPINMAFGRVFAEGYPVTITISFSNTANRNADLLIAATTDGNITTALASIAVNGPEPFRLPGGYLSREYQVRVQSAYAVQSVVLTDNGDELR